MLDRLIRWSLAQRLMVLAIAVVLLVVGLQVLRQLPVEVLPDMTRPTVTVLTECPGLAPEEVESLVTRPIESAILGIGGLSRLRSSSDVGLSLIFAEFDYGTDIHRARQLVQERLQPVLSSLPPEARPGLTPVASLMGEILLVGLSCPDGSVTPMELRRIADWTLRRRLQGISGVAEVLAMGGGIEQIHVEPDPDRMRAMGISIETLQTALENAASTRTGGHLQSGPRELMVRHLAMTADPLEIAETVVTVVNNHPIRVADVADVRTGIEPMRGDAGINGFPGVILSVDKAPGFDTLTVTREVEATLQSLASALPKGVKLDVLFRQGDFIGHAISNLREAIRDGAIMVAIVLFLFLLNVRTTVITLTAIPLSFAISLIVFKWFDISVNSMTLGGIAVAIGMVVDDAIVDVENVFRRLRENAALTVPKERLVVIAAASREIRHSILFATTIIILVFLPLLGLEGLAGRLFTPIAIATITSMAASFFVALTVIPVLCSILLYPRPNKQKRIPAPTPAPTSAPAISNKPSHSHSSPSTHSHSAPSGSVYEPEDPFLVRSLKSAFLKTWLGPALAHPFIILCGVAVLAAFAVSLYPRMGRDFLPTFNEGSATITLASAPGTSFALANEIGEIAVNLLKSVPEIRSIGRRAGRAERDDHVMPISINEFDIEFHEEGRPRGEVFTDIRAILSTVPDTYVNIGQPIGHRLAHMLSGVSARIVVKVSGSDLDVLCQLGTRVANIARNVDGMTDVFMEPQVSIPQLQIEVDRQRAAFHGLQPGAINEQFSTWIGGRTLAELRRNEQTIDLVLRLPERLRDSQDVIAHLPITTPDGRTIPLNRVAEIREAPGPNVIHRENSLRRSVVGMNPSVPDMESLVARLQSDLQTQLKLPEGYTFQIEGEYQSRRDAARRIAGLSLIVLMIVIVLLYGYFRSALFTAQVLFDIPLALIGGLILTFFTLDNLSIATLVGFIAVAGVAARNSIMLLSHYLHLMHNDHVAFGPELVIRGTLERLVPVLMTATSAGLAVVPLALAADQPGKEILHPVAIVLLGGLVTSTLLGLGVTPAVFLAFGRKSAHAALTHWGRHHPTHDTPPTPSAAPPTEGMALT